MQQPSAAAPAADYLAPVFAQYPLEVASASGVWLTNSRGERVLDLYGGHAVAALGYAHPGFTQALAQQAQLCNFQSNAVAMQVRSRAAARLVRFSQLPFASVFLVNSGAEANENALKIALRSTERAQVVAVEGSFHGRTAAAGAVTDGALKKWYGFPRTPFDVSFIPRGAHAAIAATVTERTAAVIVEPVQGLAGAVDLGAEFLRALRQRCDAVGARLIFDEVQCGVGRTGHPFAANLYGVLPDMITVAKGLTNGCIPMGAVLVSKAIYETFMQGPEGIELFHGYTYSGHPAACAAGLATLDIYEREGLLTRAKSLAKHWEEAAHALRGLPHVIDVRNYGLILGLELEPLAGKPGTRAFDVYLKCFERGVLIRQTADILALSPPLVVEPAQIDQMFSTLSEVLRGQ